MTTDRYVSLVSNNDGSLHPVGLGGVQREPRIDTLTLTRLRVVHFIKTGIDNKLQSYMFDHS